MFIQIDKGIYEKLSEAEKGVIQFLNQNEEKIPYMSITNIAEKTFTSQSTVSRAIQKQAKRIFIFARGFTALIAEEFQMYLQLLGYNAIIVKDVKWMENTERIVTKDDIAFILSLRNSTPELARSARAARMKGAKVITCCCKSPCELEKFSDIAIYGHSEQIMKVSGMTVYSRIPLLIITRTIIEYIGQ